MRAEVVEERLLKPVTLRPALEVANEMEAPLQGGRAFQRLPGLPEMRRDSVRSQACRGRLGPWSPGPEDEGPLRRVTFIDSSGIYVLIHAMKLVQAASRGLALSGASPGAYKVLDACGLTSVFDHPGSPEASEQRPEGVNEPWP